MSRSGYTDNCGDDMWALIRWRGAVASSIRGKRGQAALREILVALDSMPEKALIADSLRSADGEFCTLGALGAARGIELDQIDPGDRESVAGAFGISEALAAEIMYENDESVTDWRHELVEICGPMLKWAYHRRMRAVPAPHAAERRWRYMRDWVASQIKGPA